MDRRLALLLALSPSLASACMGIGEPNRPVRFAGQRNIVIWDADREIEHFIRDARFETKGASLAFVAPTPRRPEIVAVSANAFRTLSSLAPAIPSRGAASGGFGGGGGLGGGGGVAVVERKLVAGYEATVLKASDASALGAWMQGNGYPMPRYAVAWLARYIRASWYITAFKVATGEGAGATGPVRMTFGARTPFSPYSVPAENTGSGGLSLYYVSKGDEEARLGRVDPWLAPAWQAKVDDKSAESLDRDLKLDESVVPVGSTVRFYSDPRFSRPGLDDIYFVRRKTPPSDHGSAAATLCASLAAFAFVRVGRRTHATA